jgi:hypothetical protein
MFPKFHRHMQQVTQNQLSFYKDRCLYSDVTKKGAIFNFTDESLHESKKQKYNENYASSG